MVDVFVNADHIAAQAGGFEPQRKNNFTLYIEVLGIIIQKALHSFPMPKEENEQISVNFGNEVRKVAGRASIANMDLVVKDFVDTQVGQTLLAWRRLVYQPKTGQVFWAKTYKKTGEVVMFGPDGTTLRTWNLIGVWPSKIDFGDGSMDQTANNMITVTLSVDKMIEGEAGAGSSGSLASTGSGALGGSSIGTLGA